MYVCVYLCQANRTHQMLANKKLPSGSCVVYKAISWLRRGSFQSSQGPHPRCLVGWHAGRALGASYIQATLRWVLIHVLTTHLQKQVDGAVALGVGLPWHRCPSTASSIRLPPPCRETAPGQQGRAQLACGATGRKRRLRRSCRVIIHANRAINQSHMRLTSASATGCG